MKFIEWLEEQIGKLSNFLNNTKEDLQQFDEKVQREIEKYQNKQCGKACATGISIGILLSAIVHYIF